MKDSAFESKPLADRRFNVERVEVARQAVNNRLLLSRLF